LGRRGSCKGDSGGPLVYFDHSKEAYVQIATVQGERKA
jgi:secreted trypsin-like serine protease